MKIASLISCTVFSLSVAIIILIVTLLGVRNLSTALTAGCLVLLAYVYVCPHFPNSWYRKDNDDA